jgi:hypothetical protein
MGAFVGKSYHPFGLPEVLMSTLGRREEGVPGVLSAWSCWPAPDLEETESPTDGGRTPGNSFRAWENCPGRADRHAAGRASGGALCSLSAFECIITACEPRAETRLRAELLARSNGGSPSPDSSRARISGFCFRHHSGAQCRLVSVCQ